MCVLPIIKRVIGGVVLVKWVWLSENDSWICPRVLLYLNSGSYTNLSPVNSTFCPVRTRQYFWYSQIRLTLFGRPSLVSAEPGHGDSLSKACVLIFSVSLHYETAHAHLQIYCLDREWLTLVIQISGQSSFMSGFWPMPTVHFHPWHVRCLHSYQLFFRCL